MRVWGPTPSGGLPTANAGPKAVGRAPCGFGAGVGARLASTTVTAPDRSALLDALSRETTAFRTVLETAELATTVATCPGWDLTALAAHLAGVHRWARNAVVDGELRRDPTPSLTDRADVVAGYADSAQRLLTALQDVPAGTPCPAFMGPATVDFWLRRQVHETAVHRYDAELAAEWQPVLDTALSADGVSEVLELFVPRQIALGRLTGLPATLALAADDTGDRWVLGDGEPVSAVRADAATLLLLLWGRLGPDDVQLSGDLDVARAVLRSPLTP